MATHPETTRRATVLAAALFAGLAACAQEPALLAEPETPAPTAAERVAPDRVANAQTGRDLYINKGCVICHAVNGVGGKAAPPLDAQTALDPVDPVEFAARMWRGAPAMVELQGLELGYVIWLDAQEIVDLSAFAADADVQKTVTDDAIPDLIRDSFLDERFWEAEDWGDFLREGQEGFGEPPEVDPLLSDDETTGEPEGDVGDK